MNCLDYEILFIENEQSVVNSNVPLIKRFLEELGFKLIVHPKKGDEINLDKVSDSVDLILLDLNLKGNILGSDLISAIRENDNVADILFYSDDVRKFNEIIKKLSPLDGVYFCRKRKDLMPKIKKLIKKSIKKQQIVSNLRGLVISEAIDLEAKMSKIIIKFFGLLNHPKEDIFYEKILDPEVFMLGKKSDFMSTICKQLKDDLSESIRKNENKKENQNKFDLINKIHEEFKKIKEEIIDIRNILSHVKQSEDNPQILKSTLRRYKEIEVNDSWCIKTRKNLIKHSDNLEELYKNIP